MDLDLFIFFQVQPDSPTQMQKLQRNYCVRQMGAVTLATEKWSLPVSCPPASLTPVPVRMKRLEYKSQILISPPWLPKLIYPDAWWPFAIFISWLTCPCPSWLNERSVLSPAVFGPDSVVSGSRSVFALTSGSVRSDSWLWLSYLSPMVPSLTLSGLMTCLYLFPTGIYSTGMTR